MIKKTKIKKVVRAKSLVQAPAPTAPYYDKNGNYVYPVHPSLGKNQSGKEAL